MRKLDTSAVTNTIGMPIKSGTLTHLQDAYSEVIAAIVQAQIPAYDANTVYVLYGCVQTSPFTPPAVPITNISAGAVFYNGEVFISPSQTFQQIALGFTGALVAGINTTSYFTDPTADPVIFTDGVSRNVHQLRTIGYSYAPSGSSISNYDDFVNVFPDPPFISTALSNSPVAWANVGGTYYDAGYKVAYNEVELCGVVTGVIPAPGTFTIFTLPVGARPSSLVGFYLNILNGSILKQLLVQVGSDGQILINTPEAGTLTVYLDNIKFRIA